MTSDIRVAFIIAEFACDPELITAAVGVQPSRAWKAGDMVRPSSAPRRTSGWMLEAPAGSGDDFEARAVWLLGQLPSDLRRLESVSSCWSAKLYASVYTSGDRPPLFLSPAVVQRLSELGAAIDIDLFVLPDDERENSAAMPASATRG